jgi:hypothetical protein
MTNTPSDHADGCGRGDPPFPWDWEPSLEALLGEPMVRLLMTRDGVIEDELRALMRKLARRRERQRNPEGKGGRRRVRSECANPVEQPADLRQRHDLGGH